MDDDAPETPAATDDAVTTAIEHAETATEAAAHDVADAAESTADAASHATSDASATALSELSTMFHALEQGLGEVKATLAGLIGSQSHEKAPAAATSGEGATVADVDAPAPPAQPQTHARRPFKRGR